MIVDRASEIEAAKVLGGLLATPEQRLCWARLALETIACARQVAETVWAITLFPEKVRLNVGQVAVLELWPERSSLYCLGPVPLRSSAGVRRAKWHRYKAIKSPTERWWVPHGELQQIPEVLRQHHLALVTTAATAKKGTPFRHSHSPGLVSYLRELTTASAHEPLIAPDIESSLPFGDWETNREVELEAVKYAAELLSSEGWAVESVEAKNLGYDLLCRRAQVEIHVEVKGASGRRNHFLLTPNEYRTAISDPRYVVIMVDGIRSGEMRPSVWTAEQLKSGFDFEPIGFSVRPRTANPAPPADG